MRFNRLAISAGETSVSGSGARLALIKRHEGSRRGIVPGATTADVTNAAKNILSAVGARNPTVNVSPAAITSRTRHVKTAIEVPLNDNAWITPIFFRDRTAAGSCTLSRERYQSVNVQ